MSELVAVTTVFARALDDLESRLDGNIATATHPPAAVPQQVAAGGTTVIYQAVSPAAQRIDELDNVTLHNPTIIGGSLSGTSGAGGSGSIGDNATTTTFFSTVDHFTTGIVDALSSAAGTVNDLTSNTITATNVTFTNATTTNFAATNLSAQDASTTNLTTQSLSLGSGTGVLYATGGTVSAIANDADGKVLKLSGGVPVWGTDNTGSGGGSSLLATTSDSLAAYFSPTSIVFLLGQSATTTSGNIFEVSGNSLFRGALTAYKTATAPSFTATSTIASQLPYASMTAITATSASTSALIISGAPGGLLKTSATGAVFVATAGIDYLNSTSGDWSGTLSSFTAGQLIAAGFSTTSADAWKSNRDFFATTSTDYFITQRNFFSTTSADAWKLTRSFFATTSSDYFLTQRTTDNLAQGSTNKYYATSLFASDLAGTTTDALSQGSTNKYWSNDLFDTRLSATTSLPNIITLANLTLPAGQLTGFGVPFYQYFAATTTSALTEGSNLYYTPNRVAGVIAGTTTTALAEGNNLYFTNARADSRVAAGIAGTTTTALAEGTNKYYTDARVQTYLGAVDKGFFFSTTSADVFAAQRNFFSTSSAQYLFTLTNFFSTSSSDYWQGQRNFFSTTSASYFLAQNTGASFSTTSTTYFADASTTIPKTYTNNSFIGTQAFQNASTTNLTASYASSTSGFFGSLSIGNLSGFVKAVGGALTSALVDLASNVTGILPVGNGGTGWANLAAGAIPYGNGASAVATTTAGLPGQVLALLNGVPTWTATTTYSSPLSYTNGVVSLSTSGDWAGTLGGFTAPQLIAASFSTTSADFLATQRNSFSTTSSDFFVSQRNLFSTTSTNYWKSVTDLFSTTSSSYLLSTYDKGFFFSTTSADAFAAQRNFFATTSASYFLTQNQGAAFSTTSAIYFASASTTIAKTYAANTFTGANTFGGTFTLSGLNGPLDARNGVVGATTSIGVLYGGTGATSLTGLLQGNGTGAITAVTGTAGQFPYFSATNALLATSSLFLAASGNVGIGTTSPSSLLHIVSAAANPFLTIEGTTNSLCGISPSLTSPDVLPAPHGQRIAPSRRHRLPAHLRGDGAVVSG